VPFEKVVIAKDGAKPLDIFEEWNRSICVSNSAILKADT